MKRQYALLFLLFVSLFLAFSLTGCGGAAALGGAAFGGHKGATDKRSIGTMLDDSLLSSSVKTKMISDEFVKARHIDVDVLNGVVYLIGVVESSSQKRMAGDIARGVDGIRRVENQLMVGKTTAGQILDDTILSSRIQAELLKEPNVRSTNIDVDTNNNVITLTAIVSSYKEKETIIKVVQKTAGNRQIVDNLKVAN